MITSEFSALSQNLDQIHCPSIDNTSSLFRICGKMHRTLVLGFLVAISGLCVAVLPTLNISITSCYSKGSNCKVTKNPSVQTCYHIEDPDKRGDQGSFFGVSSLFLEHIVLS